MPEVPEVNDQRLRLETSQPSSRETQVLELIQQIEVPFLESLQREYGVLRGWRVCGPASTALSRIISVQTGVPIGRNLKGEHIELTVGIYDPQDEFDRLERVEEHTYIKYHTGDGGVYYIDPIYRLLMGGKSQLHEAIQVEKYSEGEIDRALTKRHHLYPFDPNHPGITACRTFVKMRTTQERQAYIENCLAALNGETTMYDFAARLGAMTAIWRGTEAIIKEFVPGWEVDEETILQRMASMLNSLQAHKQGGSLQLVDPIGDDGMIRPIDTEIVHEDRPPEIETWPDRDKKNRVLIFHANGERYILRERGTLKVVKNGRDLMVTPDHWRKIRAAIEQSNNQELKDFLDLNTRDQNE